MRRSKYSILSVFTFLIIIFSSFSVIPTKTLKQQAFIDDLLAQVNKVRTEGCRCGKKYMPPVSPVTWNTQLEKAALNHASDMAKNKYFSHDSKDGRTLKDRMDQAGYTITGFRSIAMGENIAWGQRSTKEVMAGWIKSENHCLNLMNPAYREVAVAEVNTYWVQNFGGREAFIKPKPRAF